MLNFLPLFKTSSFISTIPLQLLPISLCFFFFYCQISSLVELMSIFPFFKLLQSGIPNTPFTPHCSFEIVQFHVTNLMDSFSLLNHRHVPFLLCSVIHLKCIILLHFYCHQHPRPSYHYLTPGLQQQVDIIITSPSQFITTIRM